MTARQVAEATKDLDKQPTILSLDPTCLEDVLQDILRIGRATGSESTAEKVLEDLRVRLNRVKEKAGMSDKVPRVVCLEWLEPLMCAGHWVPEMIEIAGGLDCLGKVGEPSRRVEWEEVLAQQPDVVLASPCGFDVPRALQEISLLTDREGWESLPAVGTSQVYVGDANAYFSRSGPRLVDGVEILAEILHPELFSGQVPPGSVARCYGTKPRK